jgi:NitT/TauT family transport system ATP-binding protein
VVVVVRDDGGQWPSSAAFTGRSQIRDLGFVFQEPTLMPWATVADNVYLPLKLVGIGRRAAALRVEEALAMVKLGPSPAPIRASCRAA